MSSIAIMGGTFDPIHYGHLVAAEQVRHEFQCEQVLFIPASIPPHKDKRLISPVVHRLAMTQMAVVTNDYFTVSTLEIDRSGPSYTIDTVKAVKEKYNPDNLYFITGADAVLEIISWKNVEQLLSACNFVAATRPGYDISNLQHKLDGLPGEHLRKIISIYIPALAISSTDIRRRVHKGEPIKYLLPEPVEHYIKKNNLYKEV
ncbi:MAG: nicotinate-nucleotide adenylyltransferase [Firmicutes bacterium]|nr:nicotinate-nucleotide adenylyltransferase [Bacillota bacterium]